MITLKTRLARRALLGAAFALTVVACQAPDPFYRNEQTGTPGQAGAGVTGAGATGAGGTDVTGAAGAGGDTGLAGATGTAGTTGAAGVTGTGGAAGDTGEAGTTGAAGTTGRAGTTGTAGRGGTTGTAGTTGRAGTTGTAGTTGRAGTTGTAGRGGTTGAGGASAGSGGAGGAAGCPTCMVELLQKCSSDNSNQAVTLTLKVINRGNQMIALSRMTIRYYFTHMITTTGTPVLEVDSPEPFKAYVKATFTADYVQLGFTTAAGSLYPFDVTNGTGELQMRFHPTDYSNWNTPQTDDYSYRACAGGGGTTATTWTKTPVYIDGVLAFGTEPAAP